LRFELRSLVHYLADDILLFDRTNDKFVERAIGAVTAAYASCADHRADLVRCDASAWP